MNIGARLAQERLERGMTQTFVAAKLKRTPQWLNNIEKGRNEIKANDLILLAEVLNLDLGKFFNYNINNTFSSGR